ncbi:MAG: hypothetical protein WB812_17250, partial [Woeseiaceae bacterium]
VDVLCHGTCLQEHCPGQEYGEHCALHRRSLGSVRKGNEDVNGLRGLSNTCDGNYESFRARREDEFIDFQ